jgi:hypothetical protein
MRLIAGLSRSLLGGDERRAEKALELAIANEVGFELLDLVGEVRALAPHVLEARRDLLEQPVGGRDAVAPEGRTRRCQMSDLDGCECHVVSPQA